MVSGLCLYGEGILVEQVLHIYTGSSSARLEGNLSFTRWDGQHIKHIRTLGGFVGGHTCAVGLFSSCIQCIPVMTCHPTWSSKACLMRG